MKTQDSNLQNSPKLDCSLQDILKTLLVDDSFGKEKYKNIEFLEWSDEELECGKIIKLKGFPADKKVKQILGICLYRQNGLCRN